MATNLQSASDLIDAARAILRTERARLAPLLGEHDLVLLVGSSVPGALNKGDVDIHLRLLEHTIGCAVTVILCLYRSVPS